MVTSSPRTGRTKVPTVMWGPGQGEGSPWWVRDLGPWWFGPWCSGETVGRPRSLCRMTSLAFGFIGVVLVAAGVVMGVRGLAGRRAIVRELAEQKITFPAEDGLPAELSRRRGERVLTGAQAKAYSDLIAVHLAHATGGRSYAEIVDEWQASERKDERLGSLRQTAFMGQALRGMLLGAYQAWQVTSLVVGLGVLFVAIGVAFLTVAVAQ